VVATLPPSSGCRETAARHAIGSSRSQRINVRYHVQPFALEESASYVKHHLRVVGVERCPFSDSFIAAAHQFSHLPAQAGGIPRQLSRVCLNGLLIGMNDRKSILDETDAKRAIIELDRLG